MTHLETHMALSKSGIVALLLNTTFFCLYKYSETRVTKLKLTTEHRAHFL